METEYKYHRHGKPIPDGWVLSSDLQDTHHGHHSVLIKRVENVTLYHADCLEIMPTLPDNCADMILCDLPYGSTACDWDKQLDFKALWKEYDRLTSGAIVLFSQSPFDKLLACSNIADFRYEWIWEKTSPVGHLNANKLPMKAHENILVFYKKLPVYNPQKSTGHERKYCIKRKDKSPLYGEQNFKELPYDSTERYPRSVITFSSDKRTSNLHPTQKPLALCEYLIRTYTNKGQTVLDSCMGSGTTGVACKNSGRNFIGIEKDQRYFEIAKNRIGDVFI